MDTPPITAGLAPAAVPIPPSPLPAPIAGSLRQSLLDEIAACVAKHGGRLDVEACVDVAAPIGVVRALAAELVAAGAFEAERVEHVARRGALPVQTWRWHRHGWIPPEAVPVVETVAPPRKRRVRVKVAVAA